MSYFFLAREKGERDTYRTDRCARLGSLFVKLYVGARSVELGIAAQIPIISPRVGCRHRCSIFSSAVWDRYSLEMSKNRRVVVVRVPSRCGSPVFVIPGANGDSDAGREIKHGMNSG